MEPYIYSVVLAVVIFRSKTKLKSTPCNPILPTNKYTFKTTTSSDDCNTVEAASNNVFVDGINPIIARAGWAATSGNGCYIWGPLPLRDQGILQAEIWAVRCALLFSFGISSLAIDHSTVIKGLLKEL